MRAAEKANDEVVEDARMQQRSFPADDVNL
jgi:hypothetical protein